MRDSKARSRSRAYWLPPNVSKGPLVTIAPEKTDGEFTIRAGGNAAPGEYKIALNAASTTGDRGTGAGRIRISTEFVPVTIAEPYMKITLRRSSVEQGRASQLTASVELAKSFTGEAVLGLKNLPRGVKLVEPEAEGDAVDARGRLRYPGGFGCARHGLYVLALRAIFR